MDPIAIHTAQERTAALETLITERDGLVARYYDGTRQFLEMTNVDDATRNALIASFSSGEQMAELRLGEWAAAERNSMRLLTQLLQVAEHNLGRARVVSGDFILPDPADARLFASLLVSLQAAAAREKSATAGVVAIWPSAVPEASR